MLQDVKTILIVYEDKQIKKYLCLSTFFALCGIFTAGRREEDILFDAEGRVSFEGCDFLIVLSSNLPNENVLLPDERMFVYGMESECYGLIQEVLQKMRDDRSIGGKTYSALQAIMVICKRNKLRRTEYNGQFYFYVREEVENAYFSYRRAYEELRDKQREYEGNPYFWFTRGHLIRRMHELAKVAGNEQEYDTELVIGKLEKILENNLHFTAVYALQGFLAELDKSLQGRAKDYYSKYFECAGDGPYTSKVYYKLGHLCEIRGELCEAAEAYEKSYQVDKKNYRALYKKARFAETMQRDYEKAWRFYNIIQMQLEKIRRSGIMQPIEIEYLFKVYYCKLLLKQKGRYTDPGENIAERIENLSEQKLEEALFFQYFYEDEAKIYFQYMMNRLKEFKEKARN